jgi:hypothetical protein
VSFKVGDRVKHPRGFGVVVQESTHDWLGKPYQELDVLLDSGKCLRVLEEYVSSVVEAEEEA